MYNTYTIGELAKILGITPETIRYYERKGIIAPIHDEKTNYRYYTTWDLHMIIRARYYLGFGLTIDETSKILQKRTLEEIDDVLDNQEKIIEQNIIYNMNLLKKMRTNRALINNFEEKNLTLRTSPGIFRIDTQKCYTLDLSEQEKEELKQFTQYVPFIFSTALFPKEHKETEYVHYYPPRTCLYMSFSSRSSQILTYEVLEPAFEYMKKNNLELDGDIFTQIVSMWKPEEEYFNWHNIWIPVK